MEGTNIEWADNTFNPVRGCQKISPGCKNCYAKTRSNRFGEDFSRDRILLADAGWKQPLKWNRDARKTYRPRVFCASLADVFEDWEGPIVNSNGDPLYIHENGGVVTFPDADVHAPHHRRLTMNDVRRRLFDLIDATPHLDWLLLTKRPENIRRFWPQYGYPKAGVPGTLGRVVYRENVWLGTSVENQEYADKRIPELLECRDLSPVLFLSCEPLLGPVELTHVSAGQMCPNDPTHRVDVLRGGFWHHSWGFVNHSDMPGTIDWVIAGGESGPNARPSHPDWFRSLRDQCAEAEVPFHFKQWGEWATGAKTPSDFERGAKQFKEGCYHDFGDQWMALKVGKKQAGRLLDGVTHEGVPCRQC